MSARTWREDDPAPPDVVAVVDQDGVTWRWDDDEDDLDMPAWHQQLLTKYPHPDGVSSGVVVGGSTAYDWGDLFDLLPEGSEVREATAEEAGYLTWRIAAKPMGADA